MSSWLRLWCFLLVLPLAGEELGSSPVDFVQISQEVGERVGVRARPIDRGFFSDTARGAPENVHTAGKSRRQSEGAKPPVREPASEMSLDDCIVYALVNSNDARQATLTLQERGYAIAIREADFHPELHLDYHYDIEGEEQRLQARVAQEFPGEWKLSINGTGSNDQSDDPNDPESLSYNVTLSKQLLGGGSVRASRQQVFDARINEAIARNDVARVRRRIKRDIEKAYYAVVREQRTLRIQERKVAGAERNLLLARERDRIIDMTNAEVQLSEARDGVLAARSAIAGALDRLKRSMGMPVARELAIVEAIDFSYQHDHIDADADLQHALTHHEDFLNLLLRRQRVRNNVAISGEQRWPDLNVSASLAQAAEGEDYRLEDDYQTGLGVDLTWQLGRSADQNRWLQARAQDARLGLDLVDLREEKHRQIRDLLRNLDEAVARIRLAEERLQARERLVALYQDRYDNGEIDILELVRAQDDFESAKVTLLRARITYLEVLADYRFTVGR